MKKLFSVFFIAVLFFALSNNSNSQVLVSSTVPVTSINYATLTLAFTAINTGVTHGSIVGGGNAITIKITGNVAETAPANLIGINGTPISMFPTVAATITASFAAADWMINLDNADNVTIDGRINATGSTRSLTFKWDANGSRTIRIMNGSSDNMVRYINAIGFLAPALSRQLNIVGTNNGNGNNNNTIDHCFVTRSERCINALGTSGAENNNVTITNNICKNYSQMAINSSANNINSLIENNEAFIDSIGFTTNPGPPPNFYGIQCLSTGNLIIRNNYIHNLQSPSYVAGETTLGILVVPSASGGATYASLKCYNNMVALPDANLSSDRVYGIDVTDDGLMTFDTANVYNNTVLLGGTGSATSTTSIGLLFGLGVFGSTGGLGNVYNNIAITRRVSGTATAQDIGGLFYPDVNNQLNSDYNFFRATSPATGYNGGWDGFIYPSLNQYKDSACVWGCEAHTVFKDANFVSGSNLHLSGPIGGDMNGKPTSLVTTDFDGTARNATYPYRGCDEGAALRVLLVTCCLQAKDVDGEITVGLYNGCSIKSTAMGLVNVNNNLLTLTFGDSIVSGTPYYLQCASINHLESWSAVTTTFSPNAAYSFPGSGEYGGNLVGGCFIAGDVNQDSIVDSGDLLAIYNEVSLVPTGCRLQNDANSDEIVDSGDLLVTYNNISSVFTVSSPCPEPSLSGNTLNNRKRIPVKINRGDLQKQVF